MDVKAVSLCRLALASAMYDSLTPFNRSLGRLNEVTGGDIDLDDPAHRIAVIEWLNDWGCRHLSEDQHDVASRSILSWYTMCGPSLPAKEEPIWDLQDHDLEAAARSYGALKDMAGALRVRGGKKRKVRVGATAASKILFAIRSKVFMPWDEAMRASFKCDGSPNSYSKYLREMRDLTLYIGVLCRRNGFRIDDLPEKIGRPDSTVLALVNEYIWVTETRKCKLPSSQTLARWAGLG